MEDFLFKEKIAFYVSARPITKGNMAELYIDYTQEDFYDDLDYLSNGRFKLKIKTIIEFSFYQMKVLLSFWKKLTMENLPR